MRKSVFFMAIVAILQFVGAVDANAQILLGLPYEKTHTVNRTPVSYQHERESDIMWSKVVWRRIELSERANQHFFYPTTPQDGRMSLIDVLLEGIHTQGLTAYQENGSDEFGSMLTENEVHTQMGATQKPVTVVGLDGNSSSAIVPVPYNSSEVKSYLVKEVWFYDKQRSVMDVRIIGICPIRTYYRDDDYDHLIPIQKKTFWVYYPEARRILANAECFNAHNDAGRLSYEDVFQKRLFSGYVFAESNIYDSRLISEYSRGEECLLEADRIKNTIGNFEQDIWEE